jgi:hypothetical protein
MGFHCQGFFAQFDTNFGIVNLAIVTVVPIAQQQDGTSTRN